MHQLLVEDSFWPGKVVHLILEIVTISRNPHAKFSRQRATLNRAPRKKKLCTFFPPPLFSRHLGRREAEGGRG